MVGKDEDQQVSTSFTVLKFGGSLFAELGGYTDVARYVASRVAADRKPAAVVVSAMSGTTGRLQEVLDQVTGRPSAQASAMLLTSGETVSVALLTAAIEAIGLPARAMWAAEAGMFATGPPDRPVLSHIDPAPLRTALGQYPVAVLPGGQACDRGGRTVMLGRNSSDLTAVAVAAALNAPVCELFSDVPGICSADPYIVPNASTLPHVSYTVVRHMSRSGAKVVHEGAVDWAERTGTTLHCRPFPPDTGGSTMVGPVGTPAAAVVLHRNGTVWSFPSDQRRRSAEAALIARNTATIAVDQADASYLVVDGVPAAGPPLQDALAHPDLCLLTTIHRDQEPSYRLAPRAQAEAHTQQAHDALYPVPAPEQGGTRPQTPKHRSPHSNLLVTGRGEETAIASTDPLGP